MWFVIRCTHFNANYFVPKSVLMSLPINVDILTYSQYHLFAKHQLAIIQDFIRIYQYLTQAFCINSPLFFILLHIGPISTVINSFSTTDVA